MQRRWIFNLVFLFLLLIGLALLLRGSSPEQPPELTDEQRTMASLTKVDDFPLYTMTYYGDYGFAEYLKEGMAALESTPFWDDPRWACTTFSTSNPDSDYFLGRNFDWHEHPALMLFTDPPEAYAAVAMVDLHYLGFLKDQPPPDQALQNLHTAPYWSFDGMNEHGLVVSIMAVPYVEPTTDPDKVTIGSLDAIRLMLDYAKDVDEAIARLEQYNINFAGGPPLHYLIADSRGNSVVIEFMDGEMVLLRSEEPWQVSTNFLIAEEKPEGADAPCRRYRQAYTALQNADGEISTEQAMSILESVSQSGDYPTIWSIVYNRSNGEIHIVVGQQFDRVHPFELEMTD